MQELICTQVLETLELIASHGHSGFSIGYFMRILNKLVKHEPLTPLTGEEDEWDNPVEGDSELLQQNKRDSEVFRNKDGAFWIHGKIFRDKDWTYTNGDSRVPIEFPWIKPEPMIIDVDEDK